MEDLQRLTLPAILHWNFNHFVVLIQVRSNELVVHDPAFGRVVVPISEASRSFTGVAVELQPTANFRRRPPTPLVSFKALIGSLSTYVRPAAHALLLSTVVQLLVVLLPVGLQVAIDRVADGDLSSFVGALCIALVGVIAVQAIAMMTRGLVLSYLGTTLHYRMMTGLFRHLLTLPAVYFARRSLADVISRFDSLRTIQLQLSQGFLETIVDATLALGVAVVMLSYNLPLTLCVVAGLVLYAVIRRSTYARIFQVQREVIVRTAVHQAHFMETVRGITPIKLFNRTHAREAAWNNLVVSTLRSTHDANWWLAAISMLTGLISGLLWIATIWFCTRAIQRGTMTVGMVVAFVAWQQLLVSRGIQLINRLFDFRMLRLHRERIAEITEEASEPTVEGTVAHGENIGSIELINVSFRFDQAAPLILDNVSLTIRPGEFIAIVGSSGAGKTTLLKLMLGLLKPSSGEVRVGGVPLEKLSVAAFRESIGVVMQDDVMFAGTISENISFFDPSVDQERVKIAARRAAIDQDIEAMPMGYRTLVGDMGAAVSGGQRQRILLARALYRDPVMLFLDEATSHLDTARESLVNRAVSDLGMTRIIAAHRKETIQAASRIVRLHRGRLFEVSDPGANVEPVVVDADIGEARSIL